MRKAVTRNILTPREASTITWFYFSLSSLLPCVCDAEERSYACHNHLPEETAKTLASNSSPDILEHRQSSVTASQLEGL